MTYSAPRAELVAHLGDKAALHATLNLSFRRRLFGDWLGAAPWREAQARGKETRQRGNDRTGGNAAAG